MFLTVHAVSGLVIGKYVPSVWLAFILAFILHIILDIIPHDSIELENWKEKEMKKNLIIFFLIELPLIATILLILFNINSIELTPSIIAGIIGSVILDFLWGFYMLFPKLKFLKIFKIINHESHKILYKKIFISWKLWVPIQVCFLIMFLIIFVFY